MNPPPKASDRSYKRSWKNLLINKRYQLRFTLFMVVLSSLLMVGLGIWVMKFTNEATAVSITSKLGEPCAKIPKLDMGGGSEEEELTPTPTMKLDDAPPAAAPEPAVAPEPAPAPAPAPTPKADEPKPEPKPDAKRAGSAAAGSDAEPPPRRAVVQIEESSMTLTVPSDYADRIAGYWKCKIEKRGEIDRLMRGRMRILWVLIATGLMLVLGLAAYGIKMTHKVAGPLFKVSLYLGKMRDGRYDKVYNLRKGDQLLEFYEHFKTAHAGVVSMQQDDIVQLKTVIAAAEAAGAADHPAVVELRKMLERKEKALE